MLFCWFLAIDWCWASGIFHKAPIFEYFFKFLAKDVKNVITYNVKYFLSIINAPKNSKFIDFFYFSIFLNKTLCEFFDFLFSHDHDHLWKYASDIAPNRIKRFSLNHFLSEENSETMRSILNVKIWKCHEMSRFSEYKYIQNFHINSYILSDEKMLFRGLFNVNADLKILY